MNQRYQALAASISARFGDVLQQVDSTCGELTYIVAKDKLIETATALRDEADFSFETLIDVCGIDYLRYGESEWQTRSASNSGFSRGVQREVVIPDPDDQFDPERFAVVYHLLSVSKNLRLRLRVWLRSPPDAVAERSRSPARTSSVGSALP